MIPAIFPKFYMIYRYRDIVLIKFILLKLIKKENRCIEIEEKMCLHNLQHKSTTGACLGGTINNK